MSASLLTKLKHTENGITKNRVFAKTIEEKKKLEEENKRLKAQLELQAPSVQPLLSIEKSLQTVEETTELKPKRPVPAYTQFLREQYHHMKDQGVIGRMNQS